VIRQAALCYEGVRALHIARISHDKIGIGRVGLL
jgi:hypothetical protein